MRQKYLGAFRVTLVPTSTSDLPPLVRMRQLLKTALRAHALRCTNLEQILEVPEIERSDEQDADKVLEGEA